MASYRVLLNAADTSSTFGIGSTIAEFEHAKNLGYAHYLNDIGEAFWTVSQDDAKVNIRSHVGTAHVRIIRNDTDVVWRGILAELDADTEDVIMYAYGSEHILYHLLTKWNQTWKSVKIAGASGRPVDDLWARAVSLTDSQLGYASTGTLQAPETTSGGGTDITLETYKVFWKRILHAFKELVAIATSDTNNVCYFELDYPSSPTGTSLTFNFWKDRTTDRDIRLEYPGELAGFSDRYVPIFARNDLKGAGSGARDQLYRTSVTTSSGTFGHAAFGRRMEPIYLEWVRDEAELIRVTKRRAAKALREDVGLYLRPWPDSLAPWRTTGSGRNLGDRFRVKIARGITQIDKMMFQEGEQVLWVNGLEVVRPIVSDRAGS